MRVDFDSGAPAIFYEEFFSKHEPWLIEASVVSVEILTDVLRLLFPKRQFTDAYFGSTQDIMDEYCRSLDCCSLDDLLEFERELTGECHRWIPMQAGCDIMVRTDKDSFLADKFLDFDQNAVDNAIEHFVNGGEYAPLQKTLI
jgi:hypothetical protein